MKNTKKCILYQEAYIPCLNIEILRSKEKKNNNIKTCNSYSQLYLSVQSKDGVASPLNLTHHVSEKVRIMYIQLAGKCHSNLTLLFDLKL